MMQALISPPPEQVFFLSFLHFARDFRSFISVNAQIFSTEPIKCPSVLSALLVVRLAV